MCAGVYCTIRYLRLATKPGNALYRQALPDDLFFGKAVENDWLRFILDAMACTPVFVVPILLLYLWENQLWSHYWYCTGIFFIGKGLAQAGTFLPYAAGYEHALELLGDAAKPIIKSPDKALTFQEIWAFCDARKLVGDMIYSGHVGSTVIGWWILFSLMKRREFSSKMMWMVRAIGCVYIIAMCFLMLIHRFHYTVDIWIALMVSVAIVTHTSIREWTYNVHTLPEQNGDIQDDLEDPIVMKPLKEANRDIAPSVRMAHYELAMNPQKSL